MFSVIDVVEWPRYKRNNFYVLFLISDFINRKKVSQGMGVSFPSGIEDSLDY